MADNRGFAALIDKVGTVDNSILSFRAKLLGINRSILTEFKIESRKANQNLTGISANIEKSFKGLEKGSIKTLGILSKNFNDIFKNLKFPSFDSSVKPESSHSITTTQETGIISIQAKSISDELSNTTLTVRQEGGFLSGIFQEIAGALKFAVGTPVQGALLNVGFKTSDDFLSGFTKQVQSISKIDFGDIGKDVGEAFGRGLQKGVLDFADLVKESITSESENIAPQIQDFFKSVFDNVVMTAGQSLLAVPRTYQRMQQQRLATPMLKERIGQLMVEQPELSQEEAEKVAKSKSVTILVGGVNMDENAGNTEFVDRMMQPYLQDSHIVPVKNLWSNRQYEPEFRAAFKNLVAGALKNPLISPTIMSSIKDVKNTPDFEGIGDEDIANPDVLAEKILEIVAKKDMPIGKALEAIFKGFNPDDVEIAAKAAYYQQQFPDKPVQIVGTSFGGFNAAGAVQLLNSIGVDKVKGVGITTPFTGLGPQLPPEQFLGSIGDQDFLYQAVQTVLGEMGLRPEFQQVVPGGGGRVFSF